MNEKYYKIGLDLSYLNNIIRHCGTHPEVRKAKYTD